MKARFAYFCAAACVAALAACGGGGGGSGGGTPPTSSPTITPTQTPATSVSVTFGSSASSVPIPQNAAGITGSIAIPSGSGTATLTASTSNPSSVPQIQLRKRDAEVSAPNVGFVYVTLTATSAVTINGYLGLSTTLPAGSPSGTYYVGFYSTTGQAPAWISTTQTGASGSAGSAISIPSAPLAQPIALSSGQSIYYVVYTGNYIPPINVLGCVGVQGDAATMNREESPALTGVHPITSGNDFNYTGTLSQTILRSQPCPQPTATTSATVTLAVMTTGSQENTTEKDVYPNETTTLNTTANVSEVSGIYYESSETSTDGNGDTTTTNYTAPGLEYARQNESSGSWTNDPPSTVNQKAADGTTLVRTYNNNGTYTEVDTAPGGTGSNTITVNSDYSGSYVLGTGTTEPITATISAPVNGTATYSITGTTISLNYPVFIPAGAPLYKDATTDNGQVGGASSLPSGCTYPSNATSPVEQIVRTITINDPVLGYTEVETITSYDLTTGLGSYSGSVGPICTQISDTLDQYIDWSLTTVSVPAYVSLNAQPVLTNTISETLGLNASSSTIDTRQVAARLASIRFARAMDRLNTVRALQRFVSSHAALGGLK